MRDGVGDVDGALTEFVPQRGEQAGPRQGVGDVEREEGRQAHAAVPDGCVDERRGNREHRGEHHRQRAEAALQVCARARRRLALASSRPSSQTKTRSPQRLPAHQNSQSNIITLGTPSSTASANDV